MNEFSSLVVLRDARHSSMFGSDVARVPPGYAAATRASGAATVERKAALGTKAVTFSVSRSLRPS